MEEDCECCEGYGALLTVKSGEFRECPECSPKWERVTPRVACSWCKGARAVLGGAGYMITCHRCGGSGEEDAAEG